MRAVLGVLLASVVVLAGCRRAAQEATAAPVVQTNPTQILKNFEMNDMQNSVKTMTLRSIEARIYEDQKYADVDQPILDFYKNGRPSSRMTAPSGKMFMETHAVEAWGGVRVVSADSSTLTTERMRYDPKTRKILSDDPVHIEKPDSITDGIGLVTDPELTNTRIKKQKVRFKKGAKI